MIGWIRTIPSEWINLKDNRLDRTVEKRFYKQLLIYMSFNVNIVKKVKICIL